MKTKYRTQHDRQAQNYGGETKSNAEHWWKIAPWQDMKDAPLYVAIVVMLTNGKIQTTSLVAEMERDHYKKWLPLPQVSK